MTQNVIKSNNQKIPKSKNQLMGVLVFTIISTAFLMLMIYLTKRKVVEPDFSPDWSLLVILAIVALLFFGLSLFSWWALYFEKISTTVDADFVAVQSDGTVHTEKGDRIFYWTFTCQWKDAVTGKMLQAKSPSFQGQLLFYNRPKILVHVDPKNRGIHFVDITFLSGKNENGIPITGENEVEAAAALNEIKIQARKNSFLGQWLTQYTKFYERNKVVINLISVLSPVLLFAGLALLWWWRARN